MDFLFDEIFISSDSMNRKENFLVSKSFKFFQNCGNFWIGLTSWCCCFCKIKNKTLEWWILFHVFLYSLSHQAMSFQGLKLIARKESSLNHLPTHMLLLLSFMAFGMSFLSVLSALEFVPGFIWGFDILF